MRDWRVGLACGVCTIVGMQFGRAEVLIVQSRGYEMRHLESLVYSCFALATCMVAYFLVLGLVHLIRWVTDADRYV